MGGTASERSSGHCARLWTSVGHWRDGKNLERHTSDVGAHMAPLGVETAGRACYSINNTTFAMYSERDSLRRPWAHVGRSARSARIESVAMGGAIHTGVIRVGKGLSLTRYTVFTINMYIDASVPSLTRRYSRKRDSRITKQAI